MTRIVYLDGRYLAETEARVSPFDRGYTFADGVYEVTPVIGARLIDADRMIERLSNSLAALRIDWPMSKQAFLDMHATLIRRNRLEEGIVYAQITRGVAERDFPFPADARPVTFAFTKTLAVREHPLANRGLAVRFVEERRWPLRNIKTISLLGQVLARQQAVEEGAAEGWMVEDGLVTEGTASSAFIVKNGTIITSPLTFDGKPRILPGIRRAILLQIAKEEGIAVELRPFSPAEAKAADEAFQSAATFGVLPVIRFDGEPVADGKPGPLTRHLRERFFARIPSTA